MIDSLLNDLWKALPPGTQKILHKIDFPFQNSGILKFSFRFYSLIHQGKDFSIVKISQLTIICFSFFLYYSQIYILNHVLWTLNDVFKIKYVFKLSHFYTIYLNSFNFLQENDKIKEKIFTGLRNFLGILWKLFFLYEFALGFHYQLKFC